MNDFRRRAHIRLNKLLLQLLAGLWRRESPAPLEKLGSDYGGWVVPAGLIQPDWVVYCAGVGEDISFDLALIGRGGCAVQAFDFTPRAARHVEKAASGKAGFHFHPYGLWREDATLKFYAPRDPAHVSHSLLNLQGTHETIEGPCKRLSTIMAELGHRRLDLLKMDIEGAEYGVLEDMLGAGITPRVLCVEFDQPVPIWRTAGMIARLRRAGYALVHRDGLNHTFLAGELMR